MVSSFILCKNNDDTIRTCLNYAVRSFDEIIIVDGGSTDNTTDIINNYVNKFDYIRFFSKMDAKSLSEQFNYALSRCTGDWVVRMDSDEIYTLNDWKFFLSGIDKKVWTVAFKAIHLQKDKYHCKSERIYGKRCWRNGFGIKYINDGDGERTNTGPLNMYRCDNQYVIHFGHIRPPDKLINKFEQYLGGHSYSKIDNSKDALVKRNEKWNKNVEPVSDNIKEIIDEYWEE